MEYAEAHKIRNTHVDVFFLYVGNHEVESVHKTTHTLDERSAFPKSHVANMVREHQSLNKTRYKLISLLRYNHTHEMEDIMNTEPDEPDEQDEPDRFLHIETRIDDLYFADTVNLLQGVNAMFFVFSRDYSNRVKRENKGNTRRIIFNNKLRKTKRGWKKT